MATNLSCVLISSVTLRKDTSMLTYLVFSFIVSGLTMTTNLMMVIGILKTNVKFTIVTKLYAWFSIANIGHTGVFLLMCFFLVLTVDLHPDDCAILRRVMFFSFYVFCFTTKWTLLLITCLQYDAITKPLHSKDIVSKYFSGSTKQTLWSIGSISFAFLVSIPSLILIVKTVLIVIYSFSFVISMLELAINIYLVYNLKVYPSDNQQALKRNQQAVKTLLSIISVNIFAWLPSVIVTCAILYVGPRHPKLARRILLDSSLWLSLLTFVAVAIYPILYIAHDKKIHLFYK